MEEKLPYGKHVLKEETPRLGWRLSGKNEIPDSYGDYLDQTGDMVKYLEEVVFVGKEMPEIYKDAILEFKNTFKQLSDEREKEKELRSDEIIITEAQYKPRRDFQLSISEKLQQLKINQLCRENLPEIIYRMVLHERREIKNEKYIFERDCISTNSVDKDGRIMTVKSGDGANGIYISSTPSTSPVLSSIRHDSSAACFSRSI